MRGYVRTLTSKVKGFNAKAQRCKGAKRVIIEQSIVIIYSKARYELIIEYGSKYA
jgi:hypothetical protein